MRNIIALARREMTSIFCAPLAWVVLGLFLAFTGFFFMLIAASTMQANMTGTFQVIKFISLFAIPLLTMRLMSEEYRGGTIETLMTAPVTDAAVVAGKFLAALTFYLFMLAPTLIYVVILRRYGGIDLGPVASGYIGLALTGAMFIALGLLCSALTQHQIISGAAAMVLLLLLSVVGTAAPYAGPDAGPLMDYATVESHLAAFASGRIPVRDSFYFISFTCFFLFLATRAVESRRWRAAGASGPAATPWNTMTRGAILLGIACMLAGLMARQILAGASFKDAAVLGPILLGSALSLAGMALNFGWVLSTVRERRFLAGLNVWAAVALSVLLLTISNAIIAATPQTDAWFLDMTGRRVHTLSEKSRGVLAGLDRYTTITVFFATGEVTTGYGGEPVVVTRRLKDLLRLYQARGVKTQWVDIYADKIKAQKTALALNVPMTPDTLVITAGARHVQIPFINLYAIDYAYGSVPMLSGFQGEEKITSAIVALTETKQTVVYFLTGHGEFAPKGDPARSFNELTADLLRDNMKVATLNLAQIGAVPDDCGLLVIAGPTAPFSPDDAQRLSEYLQGGGKLLLAALPRLAQPIGGTVAGLEEVLAQYNLHVIDTQVVMGVGRDSRSGAQMISNAFRLPCIPSHPITKDLSTLNCVVQTACPVTALIPDLPLIPGKPAPLRSDWLVTSLIETNPQGWGESNLLGEARPEFTEAKDTKGPVSMAVAVSRRPDKNGAVPSRPATRLVVLGSTSILDDAAISTVQANRTFALNCVNWLVERETLLGIPPQRADRRELAVSPVLLRCIFVLTALFMPLAAGAAGVCIWWARRR